jgi:hypothetical protein
MITASPSSGRESRSITPCMAVQASPPQQSGISMASAEAFPVFSSRPGILFRLQRGGNNLRQKKDHAAISGKSMPF